MSALAAVLTGGPGTGTLHRQRLGPNAIIQTRAALDAIAGPAARAAVFRTAGLDAFNATDPDGLVDANAVNALNDEVVAQLDPETAHAVMRRAGERTGDYILANRIPKPAQWVLKRLPRALARRLLISAIAKNAWTFAGHARIEIGPDFIAIHDNPICLGKVGCWSCVWHVAVFETLFRTLVDPAVTVCETECTGQGKDACRFEVLILDRSQA